MADNVEAAVEDNASRNLPGSELARYKFMQNIFIAPRDHAMYIKMLERVTQDPKVPLARILIAAGIAMGLLIVAVFILTSDFQRLPYIVAPVLMIAVAGLVMAVIFMLSSREKSMLIAILNMLMFNVSEKARLRGDATLHTLGIEKIANDGVIEFENGDIGVMYDVVGQLSLSTLPAVAQMIADVRLQYEVARLATTQEIGVTAIQPTALMSQRNELQRLQDEAFADGNIEDVWRAYMAKLQKDQLTELTKGGREITLSQIRIVREESERQLEKALQYFEQSVANGLYGHARRLTNRADIYNRLAPLAMTNGIKRVATDMGRQ